MKHLLFITGLFFLSTTVAQTENLTPEELILKSNFNKQIIQSACLNHFSYSCFDQSIQDESFATFEEHIYTEVKQEFIKELLTNVNFTDYAVFIETEINHSLSVSEKLTCAEWQSYLSEIKDGHKPHAHNHSLKAAGDPCTNPDFEMCDFTNWELYTGNVPGNQPFSLNGVNATANFANVNNTATNLAGNVRHAIVSGGNDANGGFPMVHPSGTCSALLGDFEESGANASLITQTFEVSANDAVLILNYAVVLEDPNHNANEQPYFRVRVYDDQGGELTCGSYEAYAGDGQAGWQQGGGMSYLPWTAVMIPLNTYIGQDITVEFTVGDCSLGGHSGYAYVDASCQSLALTLTGLDDCDFPVTINAPVGAANYAWSTGANTPSIDVNGPGNYSVDIIPNAGPACGSTLDTVVIDFNHPTVDAGPDVTICEGLNTVLQGSGTGVSTYTWDNAGTLNNANSPTPTATPPATTVYTLTVEGDPGCFETDNVTVTVQPYADASINPQGNLCDNSANVFLTALNPGGIWSGPGIIDAATGEFSPSQAGVGNHLINYALGGLCPDDQNTGIFVEPFLDPTITQVGPYCETEASVTLQAQSVGGVWAGPGITDAINGTFNPAVAGPGVHNITYTTPGGCGGVDNINITVEAEVFANITQVGPFCHNDANQQLVAISPNGVWSGQGIIDANQGTFSPTAAGEGNHIITYTINGTCSDMHQIFIEVYPPLDMWISDDTTICTYGEAYICTGVSGGTGNYTMNWDNGLPQLAHHYVTPPNTNIYTSTFDDGCEVLQRTVTVTIEEVPQPSFNADNLTGCVPFNVELSNLSLPGSVLCEWTMDDGYYANGCTNVNALITEPGCHDVELKLTTANGCTDSITYIDYLCGEEYPTATILANPTFMYTIDTEVDFVNLSDGAIYYDWSFGDGSFTSQEFEPTHTFPDDSSGIYTTTLVASTAYGCTDTATVAIEVKEDLIFYVPNTFTPDGTGINDLWKPVFHSGFDPFSLNLYIFNRWGELIWESHNTEGAWDGTYGVDGKVVRDGTYLWKMEFKEVDNDRHHTYTGHVNILK